jgi:hypothetical protein
MSVIKDNWDKPRGNGDHLTQKEITALRTAFNCGVHTRDIARQLQCSSRIASKYYAQFRGAMDQNKRRHNMVEKKSMPTARARFYKSTFEV